MADTRWTAADVAAQEAKFGKRVKTDTASEALGVALQGARMAPVKSKYRNVKCVVQGERFDSQREADVWLGLMARQSAGEISDLKRQVCFPLMTAVMDEAGIQVSSPTKIVEVARYFADFVYLERGKLVILDAKGMKTQVYRLKKRWLELQQGIEIVEV